MLIRASWDFILFGSRPVLLPRHSCLEMQVKHKPVFESDQQKHKPVLKLSSFYYSNLVASGNVAMNGRHSKELWNWENLKMSCCLNFGLRLFCSLRLQNNLGAACWLLLFLFAQIRWTCVSQRWTVWTHWHEWQNTTSSSSSSPSQSSPSGVCAWMATEGKMTRRFTTLECVCLLPLSGQDLKYGSAKYSK